MDSIDLGDNNIPLSWTPRIRWYDPKDLLEFTNHYEKCKGLKAKEAYLNREVPESKIHTILCSVKYASLYWM